VSSQKFKKGGTMKKSRVLVLTVAFFLLLYRTIYPQYSSKPEISLKSFRIIKSVYKKEFLIGEEIIVNLVLENNSFYEVPYFTIQKETDAKGYRIIGSEIINGERLGKGNKMRFTYTLKPTCPGKLVIGPSKLKKIIQISPWETIYAPEDIGSSNSTKVVVKPLHLKIRQKVWQTNLRVGEKTTIDLYVENANDYDIGNMGICFKGDASGLELVMPEKIPVPRRQHIRIRLKPRAIKAGEIELGRAIIKRLIVVGTWIQWKGNYGASNPVPKITVSPVRLPGLEYPFIYHKKEISSYFSLFIPKLLVIALLLILLVRIFMAVLYSRLVENLFFRISIVFLIVWVAEAMGIFLVSGGMWFSKTTPPGMWEIAMIISCSCGFVLFFGPPLFKNPFLNSFLVGVLVSLSAYSIFLGFKSFDLNEFINFPVREAVFFGLTGGILLNAIFLRKELKRR
jgi:hypothetical protein